ncbi:hypothetical protein SDC9_176566 [bioreactor metagenome]|uniref:Uncharacterized protein n=1 Tax=bioreactor metagenome TaxID=1076179 RepID=A0A645GR05_9ZZZZ
MAGAGAGEVQVRCQIGKRNRFVRMVFQKAANPPALFRRNPRPLPAKLRVMQQSLTEHLKLRNQPRFRKIPCVGQPSDALPQLRRQLFGQLRAGRPERSGVEQQRDRTVAFQWYDQLGDPLPAGVEERFPQPVRVRLGAQFALLVTTPVPGGIFKPPLQAAGVAVQVTPRKERAAVGVVEDSAAVVQRQVQTAPPLERLQRGSQLLSRRFPVDCVKNLHDIADKSNFL